VHLASLKILETLDAQTIDAVEHRIAHEPRASSDIVNNS